MYESGDLQVLSSLEAVGRLERLFFGDSGFSVEKAIEYIREEARIAGADALSVRNEGVWWILSADRDWLPKGTLGQRAFKELVPFPEAGTDASRREVLLTAFADVVVTGTYGSVKIIKDRDNLARTCIERFKRDLDACARVIIFQ